MRQLQFERIIRISMAMASRISACGGRATGTGIFCSHKAKTCGSMVGAWREINWCQLMSMAMERRISPCSGQPIQTGTSLILLTKYLVWGGGDCRGVVGLGGMCM